MNYNNKNTITLLDVEKEQVKYIMDNNGYPLKHNISIFGMTMMSYRTKILRYNEQEYNSDKIILFTQFYIDKNRERHKEILKCLHLNIDNKFIDKIYLTNERIYSEDELGIKDNPNKTKIEQINLNRRLCYNDIFTIIEEMAITGYIIISNSDIFFDNTLENLYTSCLSTTKKMYSQLRFEYNNDDGFNKLDKCRLFGPRGDSQDTWIFHSNFNVKKEDRKVFNFNLGIPGCDNHIIYLFIILGYKVYNEPYFVKTYHYHTTQIRNYNSSTKRITEPYIRLIPYISPNNYNDNHNDMIINNPYPEYNDNWWRFNIIEENRFLYDYLIEKSKNNKPFILPRIAGVENNLAYLGCAILNKLQNNQNISDEKKMFDNISPTMKNNTGIKISDINSLINYSKLYISAFQKSDMYFEWEPWGEVYKHISKSHNFININFSTNRKRLCACVLDIFHNIHNNPWTMALRGKRILIVSSFLEEIQEKLPIREKIYGIDLFPECSFVFLKPPLTNGNEDSEEFHKELTRFIKRVEEMKDDFDIALVSYGGYGNLVCSEIYDLGKSSIYVGGVLQMYFGIYGNRWLKERPSILKLYMNEYWSRPVQKSRPKGVEKIEGECYW